MKGYVEIPAERVIEAVDNYDKKVCDGDDFFASEKSRLKGIVHKGWFFSETEWDICHKDFGFPNFVYLKKNYPEFMGIYSDRWFKRLIDTKPIRALALEGVCENVFCDEELSKFVMDFA